MLVSRFKHPEFTDSTTASRGICFACGKESTFSFKKILPKQLVESWKLDKREEEYFNKRESMNCSNCFNSLRSRQLARALVDIYGEESLSTLVRTESFKKLRIAEINMAGGIHDFLSGLPNLHYSEFRPKNKETKHEDLSKLSYESSYFDLVITSETLEHVPDPVLAFKEIKRVLKKGGLHIFTIPALIDRKTVTRANIQNNIINNILPPSYHGLDKEKDYMVFSEFGADVVKVIDSVGFKTNIFYVNPLNKKRPYFVFVSASRL